MQLDNPYWLIIKSLWTYDIITSDDTADQSANIDSPSQQTERTEGSERIPGAFMLELGVTVRALGHHALHQ